MKRRKSKAGAAKRPPVVAVTRPRAPVVAVRPEPLGPTPEREAAGSFAKTTTYEDEPGRARRVQTATVRDMNARAVHRLARMAGLVGEQIAAGGRFESDWDLARLEGRMCASMERVQGGVRGALPDQVLDARDRVHDAMSAVRLGGPDVVIVVEAVVLRGATATSVGEDRHANRQVAKVWASALLSAGLNLLVAHYRTRDAHNSPRRAA